MFRLLRILIVALIVGAGVGYYVVSRDAADVGSDDAPVRFPAAVRDDFLRNCEVGGSAGQCECALDRLESTYSLDEFLDLTAALNVGERESEIRDVVAGCEAASRGQAAGTSTRVTRQMPSISRQVV